jgi:hypothetical protein
MLSAIHTKIPLASLTALIAIVVAVAYQARESEKPAAAATKAAAILERQQRDAEEQTRRDEEFRQRVEKDKKRHDPSAANEGKTWASYVS